MIEYKVEFPVRYYETDQMGVVHHSNYIRYFECARSAFMKDIGFSIEKCESLGIVTPVTKVECRYLYSAKMGDVLTAYAIVDAVPLAKQIIKHRVFNQDGKLCAEGSVTVGFLDKKLGKIVPCPEEFRNLIESRLNTADK